MKDKTHPRYDYVVFQDINTNTSFLTRSTIKSDKTIKWEDGKEYPLIRLEISSYSHPFYTGQQKMIVTSGRVDQFNKKYAKYSKS